MPESVVLLLSVLSVDWLINILGGLGNISVASRVSSGGSTQNRTLFPPSVSSLFNSVVQKKNTYIFTMVKTTRLIITIIHKVLVWLIFTWSIWEVGIIKWVIVVCYIRMGFRMYLLNRCRWRKSNNLHIINFSSMACFSGKHTEHQSYYYDGQFDQDYIKFKLSLQKLFNRWKWYAAILKVESLKRY